MKLKIPVEVDLNGIDSIVDEIKRLQTYKLFEGDDMVLVNLDDVAEILMNHIEAKRKSEPQEMNGRWILVTDALPRDDEDVIVTCLDDSGDTPYSYTTVAWHYNGTWVCDNMRCPFVTAWMPLPEPYEGCESEVKNDFSKTGRCDQQRADTDYH